MLTKHEACNIIFGGRTAADMCACKLCCQQRQGAVGPTPTLCLHTLQGWLKAQPFQLNLLSPQQTLQMACLQKEDAEAPVNFGLQHFQFPQLLLYVFTPLCQVCNIQLSIFGWTAGSVWDCSVSHLQQLLSPGQDGCYKHIFVHVMQLTTFDCTARSVTSHK